MNLYISWLGILENKHYGNVGDGSSFIKESLLVWKSSLILSMYYMYVVGVFLLKLSNRPLHNVKSSARRLCSYLDSLEE